MPRVDGDLGSQCFVSIPVSPKNAMGMGRTQNDCVLYDLFIPPPSQRSMSRYWLYIPPLILIYRYAGAPVIIVLYTNHRLMMRITRLFERQGFWTERAHLRIFGGTNGISGEP